MGIIEENGSIIHSVPKSNRKTAVEIIRVCACLVLQHSSALDCKANLILQISLLHAGNAYYFL